MNYLVSYDIQDNRLRLKLAKLLLRNGCERIQKSVFLAPEYNTRELMILKQDISALVQNVLSSRDSIWILPLQQQQLLDATLWGQENPVKDFLKELYYYFV